MKTFIRRPGNKTRFLKHIIPRIPDFSGRYIEPFVGTGAVYLHLLPEKAILNDLNTDIISIWKLVRDDPVYLLKEIDNFKEKFLPLNNVDKLKLCKEILSELDSFGVKKRTAMYLILTYCSFAGTVLQNKRYTFSCLYNNIYTNNTCHIFTNKYRNKLKETSFILKNSKIYNKDYKRILDKAKKGDFVFLDPPYIEDKNYNFNYNVNNFFAIGELFLECKKLDNKGIKWMMTQIDNEKIRELFKGYALIPYINKTTLSKSPITIKELLITNY